MKLLLTLCCAATVALGAVPNQADRWEAAQADPRASIRLDKAVALFERNEGRYQKIANMRPGTVPSVVLFCLHLRESDNNFRTNPGQGDTLLHRTIHVPRGRIPAPAQPPFTFEDAATDAYFVTDHLDKRDWRHLAGALQAMEAFNGLGYQHPGRPPSPYLWAATTIERPGKYVADGRFSPTARDSQLGCCAVLKRMQSRGIVIPFAP